MVGRYVEENRYRGSELFDILQLEAREFSDIDVVVQAVFHEVYQRISDVPCEECLVASFLQDLVCQSCSGGFSVGSGDAHDLSF
ncbi:hypothetical protein ES703_30392 [subsurface metagenome]